MFQVNLDWVPAMKAVFQVNLGWVPAMTSISNMPIREAGVAIGDTGYLWDIYEDSLFWPS